MKFRIVHTTRYDYSEPTSLCYNEARLTPRTAAGQRCIESQLDIEPRPADYAEREDFFGNHVSFFSIEEPHRQLTVTASSEVEVTAGEVTPTSTLPWEAVRDALRSKGQGETLAARQFVIDSTLVKKAAPLARYAKPSFAPGRPLAEALMDLMERVHDDFVFDPGVTTISTPPLEVLAHRRGVCQDFAHLAIGFLRSLGLAARYVSGYLETLPAPGREKLRGADVSHAWVSVYVPDQGWLDFDPTNNMRPSEQHVVTAWGRDYYDVTPLKGVVFGGGEEHDLSVSVDVERTA